MSKTTTADNRKKRPDPASKSGKGNATLTAKMPSHGAIRETVESVVVAFILAFLFRTFEAEAFVIPTGSMATTLMGKHKDLFCPECGYEYQVSASDSREGAEAHVFGSTCPMCRYPTDIGPDNPQKRTYPSYSGDRILVAKFPYEVADPKRWDVIVFKFPGDCTTNYIKRLVGLPGETVRIWHGDLWIHRAGMKAGEFEIARKPPEKVLAMLHPVYDNDLAPVISTKLGWPARWQATSDDAAGTWATSDGAAFQIKGDAQADEWLRYQHLVPTSMEWQQRQITGKAALTDSVRPQLVSDMTGYDTNQFDMGPMRINSPEGSLGMHWVGDLALDLTVDVQSPTGQVVFELVKGGRRFQCRIDVASGAATLSHDGLGAADFHPSAPTAIHGIGKHKIVFSNVDDELLLWVDGAPIHFDGSTTYDSFAMDARIPTIADLSPAGIASNRAALKVDHVKLLRDVYYIAVDVGTHENGPLRDYTGASPDLADPSTWAQGFSADNMRKVQFELKAADAAKSEKDQFFVLGDNSAQSQDGRLWGTPTVEYWVERELLIGKALFIYWPHSWDKVPGTSIPFPFFPNFARMHLVR